MTKLITLPEFQIDDVIWTENKLYAYYSEPNATAAGEHQFISIDIDKFNDFLDENGHLTIEGFMPFDPSQDQEPDTYPIHILPEEFRLLDNSHTWPIIKEYLQIFHVPVPQFDGIAAAISNICSHFKI